MTHRHYSSAGFTLIEMIMVIVITGILAGMVAVFITKPVEGYVDSVRRAELTDAADVALRRITRDVRLALPNSLRLKDAANNTVATCAAGAECYVEFIITKSGGRYRDPTDGSNCATAKCISFTDTSTKTFDILGKSSPDDPPNIANGDFIVIYNLGPGYAPADAYSATAQKNITTVTVAAGTPYTVTMGTNVFASQIPPLSSPSARFQVVGAAEKVVRYGCTGGVLTRYSGCDFVNTETGCTGAALAGSAAAEPKASCTIEYQPNATGRNGLIYIQLKLTDTPSGESVTLFQQIHVDNSP
ncbi:MAG: type II secretion system protein [Rhodocyclaceae bacterium]|nr:type II secretion system protein [Rhodocyclaceae bacterium]